MKTDGELKDVLWVIVHIIGAAIGSRRLVALAVERQAAMFAAKIRMEAREKILANWKTNIEPAVLKATDMYAFCRHMRPHRDSVMQGVNLVDLLVENAVKTVVDSGNLANGGTVTVAVTAVRVISNRLVRLKLEIDVSNTDTPGMYQTSWNVRPGQIEKAMRCFLN